MEAMVDLVSAALWYLFCFGIFAVFLVYAFASKSVYWRKVCSAYPAHRRHGPAPHRRSDTITIADYSASGPMSGNSRVHLGIRLELLPDRLILTSPSIVHHAFTSIELPFVDMRLEARSWALWKSPVAIRMAALPDTVIIIAEDTVAWLATHATMPPFRQT